MDINNRESILIMEEKRKTLNSIQILRGIAAVAVMLVHHQEYIPLSINTQFGKGISGGSWGVDLFFIISGFIAAYTVPLSDSGLKSGTNYLIRRFIRIIPLYYLLTILSFGSEAATWMVSIKSIFFIPVAGGDGPIYGGARIGQGWTLNYEMYFYFVVALSYIAGKYKWLMASSFILAAILLAVILNPIPQNYSLSGFSFSPPYISMITHPVIFEFLSGVLLGLYYPKISRSFNICNLLLCSLGISIFIYNAFFQEWTGHGIQGWGWPSFLLIASVIKLERCGVSFRNKVLLWLGSCSFSVYLLHENVKNIFIKISKHLPDSYSIPHPLLLLLSVTTTFALATYTHKLIEVRLSAWLKEKLLNRSKTCFNQVKRVS